ncbi:hypothetical protein NY08_3124 [Rhodococcus sp. B7740]|nr:hypothetical protein NY08_3124 [Rhodococcus sp. B7740]
MHPAGLSTCATTQAAGALSPIAAQLHPLGDSKPERPPGPQNRTRFSLVRSTFFVPPAHSTSLQEHLS